MDKKYIAVAVVVVLIVAAVGIYAVVNHEDDEKKTVSAIARVNTEGSGIYLKSTYDVNDFYTKDTSGNIKLTKEAWDGKVFGTPGTSSIQHVQLTQLVNEMGLNFKAYDGTKTSGNVYYVDTVKDYDAAINKMASLLDGGIIWQPQYAKIADDSQYQEFLLTNDLFPGHTCCVIAGYESFMTSNPEVTVAFLAGYTDAVKYIQKALDNKDSEEYQKLLEICVKYTSGLDKDQIEAALATITYTFADDSAGSLSKLAKDIGDLEVDLKNLESISKDITSLGFKDSTEFGNAFVDDSYMKKALAGDVQKAENKTVTVAAINGDIHQIGLRVAQDLGYFENYGLNVVYKGLSNGGDVAKDLFSGNSDFGFLGAPPLTSYAVNNSQIHA